MENISDVRKVIWEDKEIKFDIDHLHENLCNGEKKILLVDHVEDSKGNPSSDGRLLATNLRLIWNSLANKNINISIGYANIRKISPKMVFSKVRGSAQALYVLAVTTSNKFEFFFQDVSGRLMDNGTIFNDIFEIYQLFQRTYLYRDIKLRGVIVKSGQLILLQNEQIYNTFNGVWNLSCDQGNLGSFVFTNIRLVWFADANETFNISLPYIQIANVRIRDSKYGPALVIQTFAGAFVLGFRIDPNERLNIVYKELDALSRVCIESPELGVHYNFNKESDTSLEKMFSIDEMQEIDEKQENEISSKLNVYLAEGNLDVVRQPVYCKKLGFAIEQIRPGYELKDLWQMIPSQMSVDE